MHLLVVQMVVVATIALKTAERLAAPMAAVATTALMSVADKIEFGLLFYFIIACKNAQQFPVRH